MKAVILAAGRGIRMAPFTEYMPKPLIPISGKPLLVRLLDSFPPEVDSFILVIGHCGEEIKKLLGNEYNQKRIAYVYQKEQNGTATALMQAKPFFPDAGERFLIAYGDELPSRAQVREALSFEYSWLCRFMSDPIHSNDTVISPDGRILSVAEKPEHRPSSNMVAAGLMVVNARLFAYPPERHKNGEYYLTSMMNGFIKDYPVHLVRGTADVAFNTMSDRDDFERRLAQGEITL